MNFDINLRAAKYFKRVEYHATALLNRQYQQLVRSLDDYLDGVLSDPFESDWQRSLEVFTSHWSERGLRLSGRSIFAIRRLIEDELEILRGANTVGNANGDDLGGIVLAANPGRRRKGSKPPAITLDPKGVPSRGRYPKGKWIKGAEGNGLLELAEPITISATNEIVTEIPFREGSPIFDKWAKPGPDIFIAMTGDNKFDQRQATEAWKAANPGWAPESDYVFHHDGQVVELGTHKGKKVFVGRMQLVPRELNRLPHLGSARLARHLVLDPDIAREVNTLAREGKGPLSKKLGNALAKRVKRISRFIPVIGGAVTLVFFAEDVEAHGVGGALIRATPMLGDIVAVYDLGTELANEIRSTAEEQYRKDLADINIPVRRAHLAAEAATAAAFNAVANQVAVNRQYFTDEAIADAVRDPLARFYNEAYSIYVKYYRQPGKLRPASPAHAGPRLKKAQDKLLRDLNQQFRPPSPPAMGPVI